MKVVLALALFAASILVGAGSFSSGVTAAGYCEGVPPNRKFVCCQKHPRAAACR